MVPANPNGVVARWRRWDATPLGLKIARTLTQGSLADSAGLEETIPLGLQMKFNAFSISVHMLGYCHMSLRDNDLAMFGKALWG